MMEWIVLVIGFGLVVYIVLRLIYVWYFCGGNSGISNYYSDSEK